MATADNALLRLREHCKAIRDSSDFLPTHTLLAVELFESLDRALTRGDALPLDWTFASRRLVTNGLPPQPRFTGFHEGLPDDEPYIEV